MRTSKVIKHLDAINRSYDRLGAPRGTPPSRIPIKPGMPTRNYEYAIRQLEASQAALRREMGLGLKKHAADKKQ